ncbi:hypothetical protein [Paraburkholderia caribensis]|uniref:hypothetical protein n=1 Tax=Paraburkholderia caribensis TaxID=75105 RepID=UPI0034D2354A
MFTVSFLSHDRLTRNAKPSGTEDELCRLALQYLSEKNPRLASARPGDDAGIVVHLYQGPLQGAGVGVFPNKPPFLWVYPVDVTLTGADAIRIKLATNQLVPDLSRWNTTPPDKIDDIRAGLPQVLLPEVVKVVCTPILDVFANE